MEVYKVKEFYEGDGSLFTRREDALAYAEKTHGTGQFNREDWEGDVVFYDDEDNAVVEIVKCSVS